MCSVHTATAQTIVCTSMVQMGWACTSVQITPLQDFGAEKGAGVYSRGPYTPNCTVLVLHCIVVRGLFFLFLFFVQICYEWRRGIFLVDNK